MHTRVSLRWESMEAGADPCAERGKEELKEYTGKLVWDGFPCGRSKWNG